MDKIKQKMQQMREEADAFLARAETAEAKLKEESVKSAKFEQDALAAQRRLSVVEDDLDKAEEKIQELTNKLKNQQDASEQYQRQLRATSVSHGDKLDREEALEAKIKSLNASYNDVEARYQETTRRAHILEQDLEKAEAKLEEREKKSKQQEEELNRVSNDLRSLSFHDARDKDVESKTQVQVRELQDKLAKVSSAMEDYMRKSKDLEVRNDRLEAELEGANDKYNKVKQELDTMLAEMSSVM